MTGPRVPASLAGWSTVLSVLDPSLAVALGPMVRQIDDLISGGDRTASDDGQFDGYGGLARRGDAHRILMSEWALATEAPIEFLRRAAESELLYLETSRVREPARGRVALLVDTGPRLLGAGRLVQLATLVVLQRRAERRGSALALGLLGDPVGTWRTELPEYLVDAWLRSRRVDEPELSDVERWAAELDRPDEMWVLTDAALAASFPGRRRMVSTTECAWSSGGATAVEIVADGHRAELALPHGDVALRALRSASLRRHETRSLPSAKLRQPTFTDASPVLLCRGETPDELVRITVPAAGAAAPRPRTHRFSGPVLAAAMIGRRVTAVVSRGGEVAVEVHGKHLAAVTRIIEPLTDLELSEADVEAIKAGPLGRLVFDTGNIVVQLGDLWWTLSPTDEPRPEREILAVLPTGHTDQPQIARSWGDAIFVNYRGRLETTAQELVLGSASMAAWREDPERWRVAPLGRTVTVPRGESVLAIHDVDDAPALVTVTDSGLIIRLRWPAGERTLTAWSGGAAPPAVHPTLPLVAVSHLDGAIEVANFVTGDRLLRVGTNV